VEILDLLKYDAAAWTILVLIAGNFLLAVSVALRRGEFDWKQLSDFFGKDIFPKIGGYAALRLLVAGLASVGLPYGGLIHDSVVAAAFGVIVASLLARIAAHMKELGLSSLPGG